MNFKRSPLTFIFITIMLDCIGIGIIIPSLPDVIRRFITDESLVSTYFGYFVSVYALLQFLSSPLLGGLSDRYGRRPILLLSLAGAALDYILMAFAPNLWILFLGRMISGLTGANMTVATAYMADISTPESRASNFGLIGAGFGIGFIVGPALGGILGAHDVHYPFLAAALFNFLNFLFGVFVLPESLSLDQRRRSLSWKNLNPFLSLKYILKPSAIRALVMVYCLFQMASQVYPSTWTLYTEHKFHWSQSQVGISLAVFGILSGLSQAWLSRIILPKIGEWRAVVWGCIGQTVGFAAFAFARNTFDIYAICFLTAIFWVSAPALQSLISADIPSNEQGELQGSLNGLASLSAIISPLAAAMLFAKFSSPTAAIYFPGAPYLYGSVFFLISCLVVFNRSANKRRQLNPAATE